jgi:hypothetical protein
MLSSNAARGLGKSAVYSFRLVSIVGLTSYGLAVCIGAPFNIRQSAAERIRWVGWRISETQGLSTDWVTWIRVPWVSCEFSLVCFQDFGEECRLGRLEYRTG